MNRAIGGGYHEDERPYYSFSYNTNEGKSVDVRFRADTEWDLDIIFNEFRNFLVASGHDIEGQIGELHHEEDDWDDNPVEQNWEQDSDESAYSNEQVWADNLLMEQTRAYREAAVQNFQSANKFSMDHLPNNGWPFGGLTTQALPTLSSADLAGIKSIDLSSINQFPTMAPLTSEQIKSWSLPTQQQINSWRVDAPGTIGGAKVEFK
jgi:hypothetical protein